MANSADPDQLAPTDLDLHCLQRHGIPGFSRTRVKNTTTFVGSFCVVSQTEERERRGSRCEERQKQRMI